LGASLYFIFAVAREKRPYSVPVANEKVIKGRNVVIFDDVVTTGATIDEARRTLEKAGVKKIKIISLAH
jgi:predicted amidophosphoribosyltransferase